jgi:hypothetical protein
MCSIKEKLNLSLISTLIIISLLFIVYMIVLHSFGFNLTPEAYSQIISALATILVVILTLGLRLIDDAFDRYEKFAKPRISSLRVLLGEGAVKNELMNYHTFNLTGRSRDISKTSTDLAKYGRFSLTKLYPQEPLNKIARITSDLNRFLALLKDIEPYWGKSDFDSFLDFSINGGIAGLGPYGADPEEAKAAVAKLNTEKPELINQTRKLREELLLEIEPVIEELDSFLEEN